MSWEFLKLADARANPEGDNAGDSFADLIECAHAVTNAG